MALGFRDWNLISGSANYLCGLGTLPLLDLFSQLSREQNNPTCLGSYKGNALSG